MAINAFFCERRFANSVNLPLNQQPFDRVIAHAHCTSILLRYLLPLVIFLLLIFFAL